MRDSYKYRIPTLHYINPLSGRLKKQVKRPLCDTLTVRMPDLTINEAESYLLLKKNVTVVFPTEFDLFSQFEGEVIGFINPEFLTSTKPLQFFEKYPYNKQYHQDIYRNMCQNLIHEFERLVFFFYIITS